MDEQAEHADRRNNRLSAQFAHLYVKTLSEDLLRTAQDTIRWGCDNCQDDVVVHINETRKPLCTVCFNTLQTSVRLAAQKGFHLGL